MPKLRLLIGCNLVPWAAVLGLSSNAQAQFAPILPIDIMGPTIDQEICRQNPEVRNHPRCQNPGSLGGLGNPINNRNVPNSPINHQQAIAVLNQGFEYYKSGEYQNALTACNSALANDPSYAAAYIVRSMTLKKLGDRHNAYLDARRAAYWSRQQNNQRMYNAAEKLKRTIYR